MQNYRNNHAYREHRGCMPTTPAPCFTHDDPLADLPIAMAYVPWQNWQKIYDLDYGYHQGTIFKELDKPFMGKGGKKR